MDAIQKLEEILAVTVEETLESMAFLIAERIGPKGCKIEGADTLQASLLVHDPYPLQFRLMISDRLAADIAKTLYSLEDHEVNGSILADVVKEMLNVIAGQVMNDIVPPGMTFKLGLPETGPTASMEYGTHRVACAFKVDELPLSMVVSGDNLERGF